MGKGNFVVSPPVKNGGSNGKPRQETRQVGLIWGQGALAEHLNAGSPLLGVKAALSQKGYSISLSVASKDEKNGLYPLYPRWLKEDSMDGYLLISAPAHTQEAFAKLGKPVVSLGYLWTDADIPSVATDYQAIWRRSIEHLAAKKLFPMACLLARPTTAEDVRFSALVDAGVAEAREALGLNAEQLIEVHHHDAAFEMVSAVRRVMRREPRVRSLVLSSGHHLAEVFEALDKLEIKVPDDLFIVVAQAGNLPMSCISQISFFDVDTLSPARRAGEKLLEILESGHSEPRHEIYAEGRFVDPR